MKSKILLLIMAIMLLLPTFCSAEQKTDTLYQVSTLQALIVGEYDGAISADTLDDYGDIGLGTFDALDGEMIVIDGKVYKARVDGTVTEVDSQETIPFANVAYINNSEEISISFDDGYDSLKAELNDLFKECNMPVAFSISGEFTNVEYRSVPEQQKPYPALTEVVANQTVFSEEKLNGTIVGFRFPEFMNDMNAVGYHLHIISDDRTKGGHLLNVESGNVKILGEELESFYVVFPENLKNADLNVTKEDVEAVEQK